MFNKMISLIWSDPFDPFLGQKCQKSQEWAVTCDLQWPLMSLQDWSYRRTVLWNLRVQTPFQKWDSTGLRPKCFCGVFLKARQSLENSSDLFEKRSSSSVPFSLSLSLSELLLEPRWCECWLSCSPSPSSHRKRERRGNVCIHITHIRYIHIHYFCYVINEMLDMFHNKAWHATPRTLRPKARPQPWLQKAIYWPIATPCFHSSWKPELRNRPCFISGIRRFDSNLVAGLLLIELA